MAKMSHPGYSMQGRMVSNEQLLDWNLQMLERMKVADMASAAYERRKPEIEEHHRERLIRLNGTAEDYALRDAMEKSWVLNDLLKKHAWNRDEANRLNLAIIAQKALREMLASSSVSADSRISKLLSEAARDAQ